MNNLLIVIERELRARARRKSTYWVRALILGFSALLMFLPLLTTDARTGMPMIQMAAFASTFFFGVAGALSTSDIISFEKREGTLGILFLTPLRGWQLLLGKLISSTISLLLILLALAPVFFIPTLFGGVMASEVLRIAGLQLVTLLLGASCGLLSSTLVKEAKSGAIGAGVLWLLFNGVSVILLALVGSVIDEFQPFGLRMSSAFIPNLLPLGGPLVLISLCFDQGLGRGGPLPYILGIALWLAVSIILLSIAMGVFQRVWDNARTQAPPSNGASRAGVEPIWRSAKRRLVGERPRIRFGDELNPYYLLTRSYGRIPPFVRAFFPLTALGLVALVIGMEITESGNSDFLFFNPDIVLVFLTLGTIAIQFLARLLICLECPRQLSEDRRSRMLELILSTPADSRSLIISSVRGVKDNSKGVFGFLVLIVVGYLFVLITLGERFHLQWDDYGPFLTFFLGFPLLYAFESSALAWFGASFGLRTASQLKTGLFLFVIVEILPWLAFVSLIMIMANARVGATALSLGIAMWHLLRLGLFATLLTASKDRALRSFRDFAAS